jgi:hypothetical protein
MLVLALLIVPTANTVTAVNSVTEETENPYNKLHFYLDNEENYTIDSYGELAQATASLKTNAATYALTDTEEKELQVTVEFSSDFMETKKYQEFLAERETLETIDEVHEWRARLNAYSKEFHDDLVAKNMKTLSDMEYSDYDAVGYSPFVILKTSAEDINAATLFEVASCDNVEHVSVAYEVEATSDSTEEATDDVWSESLKTVNAYNTIIQGTYTGDGIRIGIYEANGICDIYNPNLIGKNITINPESLGYKETPHATMVTSIVALMAPDADFYVSHVPYEKGIQYFIDNLCDVVNCSFGHYNNTENNNGTYSDGIKEYRYDIDGIYDYQISRHMITVVSVSGNYVNDNQKRDYNPNKKIVSPGYAYNVITVSGVSKLYRSGNWEWCAGTYSAYVCSNNQAKPTVAAPYIAEFASIEGGRQTGTSFAAPLATGCIALLMESNIRYMNHPELVMANVIATANKTYDYSSDNGEFDEKVGSGIIDFTRMINSDYVSLTNSNSSAGVNVISKEITLNAETEIQIGLLWLMATGDPIIVNDTNKNEQYPAVIQLYLTDYNLYLYDSSYNIVASSTLVNSNTELIRATISTSGTYTIVVYQNGVKHSGNPSDTLSLVYNIK